MPFFERARWFELNYPLLIDVGRDFNVVFVTHLAGSTPIQDRLKRVEKHISIQAILDLSRAKAAYDDYTPSDKNRVTCLEGTRRVLLKEIGEWFIGLDESRIYLLSGQAGMGKTTVAQTVAEKADNLGCLAASFFFSRDEADRRTAEKFLTTIAFQLCVYDERFSEAIGKVLATEKGAASLSKEPLKQVETLIIEPLRDILSMQSDLAPIVIVVDALDECDERDARNILLALDLLVKDLPSFKVMLTTRPDMDFLNIFIRPEMHHGTDFHGCTTPKVLFIQNIEDKVVDGDIRLYLKYKLSREQVISRLSMLREPWSASEHDIETLVLMSGRLFIIASTAVFFLLDTVVYDPASQMEWLHSVFSRDQTPFHALNDFYTTIIRRAVSTSRLPRVLVAERFHKVMGTIVLIQEPLPIKALAALVGSSENYIHGLLTNLQSVVSFGSNDVPRIYHKSFSDFIVDPQRCREPDILIEPTKHQTRIAIRCFQIMNNCLRRNIIDMSVPACFMKNEDGLLAEGISPDRLHEKIPAALQYSCTYWGKHVEHATPRAKELVQVTRVFANEHLLHWFETMSWIGKLHLAHDALRTLDKHGESSELVLVSDALRFIAKFYELIRQSALHVYYSALPFTPTECTLYKRYQRETFQNFCHVRNGPRSWDAMIATLPHGYRGSSDPEEGAPTESVFSRNGSLLASWNGGEMKIWDMTSVTPIAVFEGNDCALADDFSTVALAQDTTVTVRSLQTDAPIPSFEHSLPVQCLTYTLDGSRLATALSNGTVILWDVAKHEQIASINGYEYKLSTPYSFVYANLHGQLSFSPDGRVLAFRSTAGDIELWDARDGNFVDSLDHGRDFLIKFFFSGDGSRLVSLTCNRVDRKFGVSRLRLWKDMQTVFLDFDCFDTVGLSVAITADGSFLAAGGVNVDPLRIWRRDSDNHMSLTDGPAMARGTWVEALTFSSECLAINMFRDGPVMVLYDFRNHAVVTEITSHSLDQLRFSPDATKLVAWSEFDTSIYLWDVASMKNILPGAPIARVEKVSLSPDCSKFALWLLDGTFELWDTGNMERLFSTCYISQNPIFVNGIEDIVFSPDSQQFAIVSSKGISLRESIDGNAIATLILPEYRHIIGSGKVASSGNLLAAGMNEAIALWDLRTLHPFHSIDEEGNHLTFSNDGSTLAFCDRYKKAVKLWQVGMGRPFATFNLEHLVLSRDRVFDSLKLSNDGSQLGILICEKFARGEALVDVRNNRITRYASDQVGWLHICWHGIPMALGSDTPIYGGGHCLIGRFSRDSNLWVPFIHFPRYFHHWEIDIKSTAVVLGSSGRNVILVQPSDIWTS